MKLYTLNVVLFLLGYACVAQKLPRVDSLKACLDRSGPTQSAEILFQLAAEYGNAGKNAVALPFTDRALEVARRNGDSLHMVKAGRAKAQLLLRLSRYTEAQAISLEVLPIAVRHALQHELAIIYNNLGLGNTLGSNYHEALKYHFKSLKIRKLIGDKAELSVAYHNIGFLYYKLKNFELALEYFLHSLSIKRSLNDPQNQSVLFLNIGLCYACMGCADDALRYIHFGLNLCTPNCSSSEEMQGQFALGVVMYLSEKPDSAEAYFRESYARSVRGGDFRFQSESLLYLGRLALQRKDFDSANAFLTELQEIAVKEHYNLILKEGYHELAELYKALGDYRKASLYQDKYAASQERVFNEEVANRILAIHSGFAESEHQLATERDAAIIARQKLQNIMMVILLLMFFVLVIALYKLVRLKHQFNQKLGQKVRARTHLLARNEVFLRKSRMDQLAFFSSIMRQMQHAITALNGIRNAISLSRDQPDILQYAQPLAYVSATLDEVVRKGASNANPLETPVDLIDFIKEKLNTRYLHDKAFIVSFKVSDYRFTPIHVDVLPVLGDFVDLFIGCATNEVKVEVINSNDFCIIQLTSVRAGIVDAYLFRAKKLREASSRLGIEIILDARADHVSFTWKIRRNINSP